MHHELSGNKHVNFDASVSKLLDCERTRANPIVITDPGARLHNFVTQIVNDEMKYRLLKVFEDLVLKTKKACSSYSQA